MALPEEKCGYWNKNEQNLIAEIGPNWNRIGVGGAFQPCKFGDGYWNNTVNDYLKLTENFFTANQFILEIQVKPDFSVINGVPVDGKRHALFHWYINGTNAIQIAMSELAAFGTYFFFNVGGVQVYFQIKTNMNMIAGNIYQLIFCYNQISIAGSADKCRLYLEGNKIFNSVVQPNIQGNTGGDIYSNVLWNGAGALYPSETTIDNPRIYFDTSQANIDAVRANNPNEGWLIPYPVVAPYEKKRKIYIIPQVLILSQELDIYPRIDRLTKISERKTFRRDKLITNHIQQEVDNADDSFSINNRSSLFHGLKWEFDPFIIKENGQKSWDGIVEDITRDHRRKKIKVLSTDKLFQFKDTKIEYESGDWETPAAAWKNICDDIGFDHYDITSINASNDVYVANNCYIKCNINKSDNITFQPISEKLAEIGSADCFTHKNRAYFVHMSGSIGSRPINVKMDASDLLKEPLIKHLDIINNYRIGYEGSDKTPATDQNSDNIGEFSRKKYQIHDLPEFQTGDNSQIMFKDKVSAVYIGNSYLRRTHVDFNTSNPKKVQVMDTAFKIQHKEWVNINKGFFMLTYPDESWYEKLWDMVFSEIILDRNIIYVQAYEVDTS